MALDTAVPVYDVLASVHVLQYGLQAELLADSDAVGPQMRFIQARFKDDFSFQYK
jgi:hypothetical protein